MRSKLFSCRTLGASLAIAALAAVACATGARSQTPPPPAPSEKASRTAAQQKINSQVLFEIYRRRGIARQKNVPAGDTGVRIDRQGRALVDVRAEVTPALRKKVASLGATIVTTSQEYRSIVAWIPLLKIEQLAALAAVRAIEPAAEAAIK